MNDIKHKVLSALSGPFLRKREDPVGDLSAQIEQNEHETIYRYRDEEFREPTASAIEASELNEHLIRDYQLLPVDRR